MDEWQAKNKIHMSLPQYMFEAENTFGKRFSGMMRPKFWSLKFLVLAQSALFVPALLIILIRPFPQWSMVVASCYGNAYHQQRLGNWSRLKGVWMKPNTEENLFQFARDLNRGGGSPSNRTMALSTLPKKEPECVRMAQSKSRPQANEDSVKDLKIVVHHWSPTNQTGLEHFCQEKRV